MGKRLKDNHRSPKHVIVFVLEVQQIVTILAIYRDVLQKLYNMHMPESFVFPLLMYNHPLENSELALDLGGNLNHHWMQLKYH